MNDEIKKIWLSMIAIHRLFATVMILCSLVFLGLARADTAWLQKAKLTAADGVSADHFGKAVAINGDYAIVGSACSNDKGTDSGSAYIFKWDGTGWIQQQKLIAADGATGHWFGCCVAISGNYAVVGARYGDGNITETGTAYVFWWDGNSWVQQAKLNPEDGKTGDCFGISVSINKKGNKVIVGAFCDDFIGSAYFFKRDGTQWKQEYKIMPLDGDSGDAFGRCVSMTAGGDEVVVGSDGDDDKGTDAGAAYIYKWDGRRWLQRQKLTALDGTDYDFFGKYVSISNDKIIVGAGWDDDKGVDSGSAYIYKKGGRRWVLEQKLTASDGATYDWFGYSVSISGDYAIIGACNDDDMGTDSGSAYIFRWDGTRWVQQQKLIAKDGAHKDGFGKSVFISGDMAIIGALLDDDKGTNSGSAYIFTPRDGPAR